MIAGEKKDRWVDKEGERSNNGCTVRSRKENYEESTLKGGDFYSEESYKSLTSLQGEGGNSAASGTDTVFVLQGKDREERFDRERKERVSFPSLLAKQFTL